jgi:hypothetical protein
LPHPRDQPEPVPQKAKEYAQLAHYEDTKAMHLFCWYTQFKKSKRFLTIFSLIRRGDGVEVEGGVGGRMDRGREEGEEGRERKSKGG